MDEDVYDFLNKLLDEKKEVEDKMMVQFLEEHKEISEATRTELTEAYILQMRLYRKCKAFISKARSLN